jgi:AGZA family xanthine/uracil permease-like MFS transporter
MLERLFGLKARGTNVRIELVAGLTTFLTMAYIVAVNPAVLGQAGMPEPAVAAATCLAAAFGCIMMGLAANYPLAMAPGMGLNAYFTFTVVEGMGVPWPAALACVFLAGLVFLALSLSGARRLIVEAIPRPVMAATAGGIGLFIAFIGLKDAGVVVADPATTVRLGDLAAPSAALALGGLLLAAALQAWRVRGAILIGVLAAAAGAWALGLGPPHAGGYGLKDLSAAAFRLDLKGALALPPARLVEIVLVFLFVDVFDNVGTLAAVSREAGLQGPDGRIARLDRVLLADAAAPVFGALVGTSPVVSYVESAAGVAAGGRTGLTAVTTGVLFLVALAFAPLARAIPTAAAAPALVLVGSMMLAGLKEIDWSEPEAALPAFLTLVGIPLSYSIADGLGLGVVSYAALRLLRGRAKRSEWLVYLLAALFVVRFFWLRA